jgi:hypothetical protein
MVLVVGPRQKACNSGCSQGFGEHQGIFRIKLGIEGVSDNKHV